MGRFDYVKYDDIGVETQTGFKLMFEQVEAAVTKNLKPARAQALVLTKLEEAYMWVGKAIRDEQIARKALGLRARKRGAYDKSK